VSCLRRGEEQPILAAQSTTPSPTYSYVRVCIPETGGAFYNSAPSRVSGIEYSNWTAYLTPSHETLRGAAHRAEPRLEISRIAQSVTSKPTWIRSIRSCRRIRNGSRATEEGRLSDIDRRNRPGSAQAQLRPSPPMAPSERVDDAT